MKKLIWLLLLLTLIACGPAAITTPTVTPVPSSTPAPTATNTSAPTATSTLIAGAPIERCVEILPEFPKDSAPSDTLVVEAYGEGFSLLNFDRQTQRSISGMFEGVGTSPDGKWLSYISYVNSYDQEITIESSDGKKKIKLPFESEWMVFGNPWLSNEKLSFLIWDGGYGLKTVALNPFTGEKQVFLPDYPNFNNNYLEGPAGSPPLFFRYSNVAYDPSLRFVVYPQDNDDGLYDALWDRQTNQEIAKVLTGGLMGYPPPIWFSDSHAFVVVAYPDKDTEREWFMVSRDGKISQLTNFGNSYIQHVASLSADGHYLSFGLNGNLIILDLKTSEAVNTCIPLYDNWTNLIWSPDSRYLAVDNHYYNPEYTKGLVTVYVLDIEQEWAVKIFDNINESLTIDGWLASGE